MKNRRASAVSIGLFVITAVLFSAPSRVLAVPRTEGSTAPSTVRPVPETQAYTPTLRSDQSAANSGGFMDTGADACNDVQIITVPIGAPGNPITTSTTGDNTGATAPDCQATGTHPTWWEAFELTECATVRIDLCGTTPVQEPSNGFLVRTCPASGTNCGNPTFRNATGRGAPYCGDNNAWFIWNNLQPGVYYYPVYSDPTELVAGPGPYQLQITAEACPGACCDLDLGTCTDNVAPLDCTAPNQLFAAGQSCCQAECRPPGDTYAAFGVELLSHVSLSEFVSPGGASDIWGYTSPSGREYAIIGLDTGTGFVEITDPFNPVVIAQPGDPGGFGGLWSDMRTYQHYAYNVNDQAGGGMQIFDLANIDSGVVQLVNTFTGSGLQTVHNVSVNEASGYLYLTASNLAAATLIAMDLNVNPAAPTFAGTWIEGLNQGIYVHDVQVITYTSGPYAGQEIAFAFGGDGLYIVDVTDKNNMHTRGTVLNQGFSFGHQGWFTEDLNYILMGDEGGSFQTTTYVIDIQDIDNPTLMTSFGTGKCTIDHNQMIRGSFTYQADYTSGLRILDISDPLNAQNVAYFDTHPEGNNFGFSGAWGVFTQFPSGTIVVSDMQRGLFVLNFDCNDNGIDDTEDIDLGTSDDSNLNGIPDECECGATLAAASEPGGEIKNRYLSLVPNNGPRPMGIRVELTDLPSFPGANGTYRWAGPPQLFPGNDNQPSFWASPLQCDPYIGDFSNVDVLHLFGPEIVPGSTYAIQPVHEACNDAPIDEASLPAAFVVATAPWGDIVSPFGGGGQPNFADITALVDAFKGVLNAPIKARAQLQPSTPNPATSVSFADITLGVGAFKGFPFPFVGPGTCPP